MNIFSLSKQYFISECEEKIWKDTKTYESDYTSEKMIKNHVGKFSIVYSLVIFFGKLYSCIKLTMSLKIN